ncbi:hypothetical protein D3C84_1019560 [compost metagenome]
MDKLDQFVADVTNKTASKIRVTRYTKEGDPIFIDLHYDGKQLLANIDSSLDTYGGGTNKSTCTGITKAVGEDGDHYNLVGCQPANIGELLVVPKG